jgi:type IV secretory pathway VirJ component
MVVWARADGGAATLAADPQPPLEYQTRATIPADPQFVKNARAPKDWEPARVVLKDSVDLRGSVEHASRRTVNKRRRDDAADILRGREDVEKEGVAAGGGGAGARGAASSAAAAAANSAAARPGMVLSQVSSSKRARVEGAPYRPVSGKTWKVASARAGAAKAAVLGKNSSWEKMSARRDQRRAAVAAKREAAEQAKDRRRAAAQQRAAAKERKKANQAKSAVIQPVNSATVKKMMKSKKQRKLLRKIDSTTVEAP